MLFKSFSTAFTLNFVWGSVKMPPQFGAADASYGLI